MSRVQRLTSGALGAIFSLVLGSALYWPGPLLAQPPAPLAQQLREEGAAALTQHKSQLAQSKLEQAYLLEPSAELLKLLGDVAEQQGQPMAAADLFRRHLEEASAGGPPAPGLVERIAAAQKQAAEVAVSGPAGAFLRVDGRLSGRLELSRSLLLTPGEHLLTLEQDRRSREHQVSAVSGVPTSVHFAENADGSVLETRPPTVLLLYNGKLQPGSQLAMLKRNLLAGLRHDGQAHDLAPELAAAGLAGEPNSCVAERACLLKLAARLRCRFVLQVQFDPAREAPAEGKLDLLDVTVKGLSTKTDWQCPSCSEEQSAARLRDTARSLLGDALARPSGDLRVTSSPAGAGVSVDGQPLPDQTPSTLRLFGGPHQVTLRKPGYRSQPAAVTVNPEALATLELTLSINLAGKTRQRLAIGQWTLLAAGVAAVLGGSVAVALNGQRRTVEDGSLPVEQKLLSWPAGVAVLGVGTLALGTSAVLWGLKRRARRAELAAEQ